MRLYSGKTSTIADEVLGVLTREEDIEVLAEENEEARLDIEACLKEYIRTEREIGDQARDLLSQRGLDQTSFGKIKRQLAEKRGFGLGEESIGWIANQIINMLLHSVHVEEVFSDDNEIRRKVVAVLRKHMSDDAELDKEVRRRIKNLEEGSNSWEVEYQKVMSNLMRTKKLI